MCLNTSLLWQELQLATAGLSLLLSCDEFVCSPCVAFPPRVYRQAC